MSTAELALLVALFALGVELVAAGLLLLVVVKLRPVLEMVRPMFAPAPTSPPLSQFETEAYPTEDLRGTMLDIDGEQIR